MSALAVVELADRPQAAAAGGVAPRRARGESAAVLGMVVAVAAVGASAAAAGIDTGRLVVLLALAPLFEETIFRAGLHEALLRRASLARHANLVTALAFGLAHAIVQGHPLAVAVGLPAWFVGMAYERRRRVRVCVALHALFNALWIAWVVAGPTVA